MGVYPSIRGKGGFFNEKRNKRPVVAGFKEDLDELDEWFFNNSRRTIQR